MEKVVVIGVYMGRFPAYIDAWIHSLQYNPTIDFLVVTDQERIGTLDYPANLRVIHSDLEQFKALAEKKIGMHIRMEAPYKVCDYKCLYGLILEDEIKDYDYWGECDFDVIFGDLRHFLDKYELNRYDKFFNRGHLTLYRNTEEVNNRFRLRGGAFGSYKEIFRSDMVWGLDEMYGINRIYEKYGFSAMNEFIIADIDMRYSDLRLVPRSEPHLQNYQDQIFYWKDGKIFREWLLNGEKESQEFAYIHLAKRKFKKPEFDIEHTNFFYITPDGLKVTDEIDKEITEQNKTDLTNTVVRKQKTSRFDKKLKFFWIGRRYLNIKYKINHRK